MIDLGDLAKQLRPEHTVLFLGAGASVPSGAPSGPDLAARLSKALSGKEAISDDFSEVCSILAMKYGRDNIVKFIRSELSAVKPTGGLLALPSFAWSAIYSTNFDRLMEDSYRAAGKELTVIRSNFDYGKRDALGISTTLFKIHGCVTQDTVDGSNSRLVLTEDDYAAYLDYREALFRALESDLLTKNILIIGHSLRDPHLRRDLT